MAGARPRPARKPRSGSHGVVGAPLAVPLQQPPLRNDQGRLVEMVVVLVLNDQVKAQLRHLVARVLEVAVVLVTVDVFVRELDLSLVLFEVGLWKEDERDLRINQQSGLLFQDGPVSD